MFGGHRPPLQAEELLPGLRQFGVLYFARDASLEFGLENRAGSVNHDDVFRAFYANGVRDAGWNDHSHIVAAAMIIAIDEETHDAF